MDEQPSDSERLWEIGWEGHERAQLLRMARLPLHVKIRWLEEAQRIAEHLSKSREPAESSEDD